MITPEQPKINNAGRYPISKAALILGIHRTTLLRWLDSHRAKCSYNRQGRRFLTGRQIIETWNLNA